MVFGKFIDNINSYGFIFGDLKYFDWFKKGKHFQDDKKERFRNTLTWKRLIYYSNKDGKKNGIFEKTWNNFQAKQLDEYPTVTRAFLNHLHEPIKFPIFDKHVWKAMRKLRQEIADRPPENIRVVKFTEHYFRKYKPFFDEMFKDNKENIICPKIHGVDQEIVKRRVLDRSLWLYGKVLNNNQ